jgi:prepilin-type N-terminal cleavage/methylation domain-containing protein
MSTFSSRKGFTLIELLVVIAIIALLSSVVLASLASARVKSRDARRVADLHMLQLAMELYYDKNQTYFIGGTGVNGNGYGLMVNYAPAASPAYPKAITQELYNQGFLSASYINDPLAPSPQSTIGYEMNLCDDSGTPAAATATAKQYSIYATKEAPTASDLADFARGCNNAVVTGSPYFKNYVASSRFW